MRHGTTTTYSYHRCRCDDCRDAWNRTQANLKLLRAERPIPAHVQHGTVSTYNNWSCRCEACFAAKSDANAAARARRKAAS